MINLSTSAAAHAYACRTAGGGSSVGNNNASGRGGGRITSRRHIAAESGSDGVGHTATVGGLELLGQGYADINGFRNNRFQYQIPTVGQHYGNAFHLAEDDDEVTDLIVDHRHHHHAAGVQHLMEEHIIEEDDDEEEDVEISTAVEVISIDPDCDYDTDEEDDEEEEEEDDDGGVEEDVEELEHEEQVEESGVEYGFQSPAPQHVAHNVTLTVDFSPSKAPLWELPEKLLQDESSPKKTNSRPRGRRKRTASQRQSFSMPQSPSGGNKTPVQTANGVLLSTSLSFDDLESFVCDLSPLKAAMTLPAGKAASHEALADDLLEDELDAANFDLTSYITGDDSTSRDTRATSSDACNEVVKSPAKRSMVLKSRGKELKTLRQLMLPQEEGVEAVEESLPNANKRVSAAKAVRRLTMEDGCESDSEAKTQKQVEVVKSEAVRRGTKRKAIVDDTVKDPTWNPNGGGGVSKPKHDAKVPNQKQSGSKTLSSGGEEAEKAPTKTSTLVAKGVKFGQVIRKEGGGGTAPAVSLAKKSAISSSPQKRPAIDANARTNVHQKKTNVKLDHDYCTPKRASGGSSNGAAGLLSQPQNQQQRKTIQIPFLLPTKEQLRQERKLQKERKRTEQHQLPSAKVTTASYCTDNNKDKQMQPCHNQHHQQKIVSTGTAVPCPRTDVDKTFVNKATVCSSSDSGDANEVSQSHVGHTTVEVKKQLPTLSCSSSSGVKRQVSLLKINQPNAVPVTVAQEEHGSGGGGRDSCHVSDDVKIKADVVKEEVPESSDVAKSDASVVVVRKKLNLQEYKKRREHPIGSPPVNSNASGQNQQQTRCDGAAVSAVVTNSSIGYSNSKDPRSIVVTSGVTEVKSEPKSTTTQSSTIKTTTSATTTGPLDPISAAKMKALRMQQLKKEAAIKSHEMKLSQKTIPLMPILPLAEITSLEFDEHGNPLPLDVSRARAVAQERDSLKLHPDYEEIIIVSIGCNTALTIAPSERVEPKKEGNAAGTDGNGTSTAEVTRLQNISDTLKRCCPSVGTMPGSSLIASIQEVVIKKSNITESAVTLKAETAATGGSHQQQHQQPPDHASYIVPQSSPYVGVSPPSSFSPGKPERAHITNAVAVHLVQSPTKQQASCQTKQPIQRQVKCEPTTNTTSAAEQQQHGEDKVIMHLRKDRVRTQRVDASTQTDACTSSRFTPLCKLAPVPKIAANDEPLQKHYTERRSYRRRHRGTRDSESDADSDAAPTPAASSRSQSHHRHRSHSHSRSRSRHRRSHSHKSTSGRTKSRTCSRSSTSSRSSRYGSSRRRRSSRRRSRSVSSSSSSSMSDSSYASYSSSENGRTARRRNENGMRMRRSSSRSRSRSPRRSRSRSSGMRSNTPDDRQRYLSREPPPNHRRTISPERKIVYIGRLETNARKEDLQQKFQPYGKIVKITLHVKANGSRYGFVTFEKPQHAYDAIDARGTDPNLRNYDVSFGGRRAFCRTQYADLDGELSTDHDHQIPYVALDGSLLVPTRGPMLPYSGGVPSSMCHKDSMLLHGGSGIGVGASGGAGGGSSFDDLLKQFKKEICARKT
uniref:RRM domain-containing protein n=1 Tax=Anopheles farauti TaxID=69004 RepID=A0A182QR59_9DIPT